MNTKKAITVSILYFISLLVFLPTKYHGFDVQCWLGWTIDNYQKGLGHVYEGSTNYPPFIHYCFFLFSKFQGSVENIERNIVYIKVFPLFFDFLGAFALFFFLRRGKPDYDIPLFLLVNAAYLYNSYLWGQFDSIYTAFVLFSFLLALREKGTWSMIFYILALNMKIQAIIFLPLLSLVLLPQCLRKPLRITQYLLAAVAMQVVILIPWIITGSVGKVWQVAVGSVDFYPKVSMGALNIWELIISRTQLEGEDTQLLWGMTYKQFGLLNFCIASFFALFPLLLASLKVWRKQMTFNEDYQRLFFLSAALIALVFYYFNTQMHERYCHPAMILFFAYCWYIRNYWLYILFSIAYFLSLEKAGKLLYLPNYNTMIFKGWFVSIIFAIILLISYYQLYRKFQLKNEWAAIRKKAAI
ncbi:MAG: hypothetical protein SFW35_08805 [Chitinophagales bacterium]|nr:hypothetical protein [Chitinophagales bacterium]